MKSIFRPDVLIEKGSWPPGGNGDGREDWKAMKNDQAHLQICWLAAKLR
jgi:hypothetical protein